MDPLSAIGLASAIVQFVDFGSRIVSGALEISRSATGATRENAAIENATTKLQLLNDELTKHSQSRPSGANPQDPLLQLTQECVDLSEKLIVKLAQLKAGPGSTRYLTFRKALKTVWQKDKIDAMQTRLGEIRDLQMLAAIVNMRYVR